jgi:dTDP-4-amino-4,6-dideoxygalactose transaminase
MYHVMGLAKKYDLQVIEDSCETMFAKCSRFFADGKQSVGSFGDFGCFSTYVAHLIVGGVGGIVTTDDDYLAEICRSLMAHGRDAIYTNIDDDDSDDPVLRKKMIERRYSFERVGYSYRATELEAAIALSELLVYKTNISIRQANAQMLTDLLKDIPELCLPRIPADRDHVFMMYPIVASECIERDRLLMFLEERGIETRYLFPLLSQPIYKRLFPDQAKMFPVAQHLAMHGFFIGMHQGLTGQDMHYISEVFHEYFI